MATVSRVGKWRRTILVSASASAAAMAPRSFRSDAALEALAKASDEKVPSLLLYNYSCFSGAFSRLNLPLLSLPLSSVEPFRSHPIPLSLTFSSSINALSTQFLGFYRVNDLCTRGLERCYFVDFLGPRGFAVEFARRASCDEFSEEDCPDNLTFRVNTEKSSSSAVYDYFSAKLAHVECRNGMDASLLQVEDRDRVEMVLKYIEDGDLRHWSLPDIRAFNIGLGEWRSKLNCFTNPYIFSNPVLKSLLTLKSILMQLLETSAMDVIAKGKSYISARQKAAKKLLDKALKIRLGRGFYGECLGVRVDGNSELSDEIGKQLSVKSATAGLRPIGAVLYMQRKNLKMCLRSIDTATDTSEVAKAYGGGGTPSCSSFIIRMDKYNQWVSGNSR